MRPQELVQKCDNVQVITRGHHYLPGHIQPSQSGQSKPGRNLVFHQILSWLVPSIPSFFQIPGYIELFEYSDRPEELSIDTFELLFLDSWLPPNVLPDMK